MSEAEAIFWNLVAVECSLARSLTQDVRGNGDSCCERKEYSSFAVGLDILPNKVLYLLYRV